MKESGWKVPYSQLKAARQLFGENNYPSTAFRFAVREEKKTLKVLQKERAAFGDGYAGGNAFSYVAGGGICEVVNDEKKTFCKNRASGTIDFDAFGTTEHVLFCPEHERRVEEELTQTLLSSPKTQSWISGIGKNGRGRS